MAVKLKECPRCGGDLLESYNEEFCLQCSYKPSDNRREATGMEKYPLKEEIKFKLQERLFE